MDLDQEAPNQAGVRRGRPRKEVVEARERLAKLNEAQAAYRRIKELRAEQERLKKEESIRFYSPHPQQEAFHRSKAQTRLVFGGNRSGKTQAGCSEDFAHAIGFRPWLPKDDPDYKINIRVPNKGLVVGESFGEQVAKVLVPKFLGDPEKGVPGVIPKALVAVTKKNQQGVITMIKLTCGSTITFQSYDQAEELFEGADYDWAHPDEPPPHHIWIAIKRGLTDRHGRAWFTMTPLKEPWIHNKLANRDDIDKFYFDMQDNVGYGLTQEAMNEFVSHLTEDEIEVRVHGRFFHLTGLVYKSFSTIHRISRHKVFADYGGKLPENWNLWMHIDPHPRTPHHAIWIAVAPNNVKYVVGELKNTHPDNNIEAFVNSIYHYESDFLGYRGHVERLIDPSAKINNPVAGYSIYDAFWELGIRCKDGSKDRDGAITITQHHLSHDIDAGKYPVLFFCDDLSGTIFEMQNYVWDDWTKKTGQMKTEKQVPRDKDDHFIEGMHRILLENPEYEAPGFDNGSNGGQFAQMMMPGKVSIGY